MKKVVDKLLKGKAQDGLLDKYPERLYSSIEKIVISSDYLLR